MNLHEIKAAATSKRVISIVFGTIVVVLVLVGLRPKAEQPCLEGVLGESSPVVQVCPHPKHKLAMANRRFVCQCPTVGEVPAPVVETPLTPQ